MIAQIVSLEVLLEHLDEFLAAIEKQSRQSVTDEPGCHSFDVVRDLKNPFHFMFYGLYEDESAVEAHRLTPHFPEFQQALGRCLRQGSLVISRYQRLFHHTSAVDNSQSHDHNTPDAPRFYPFAIIPLPKVCDRTAIHEPVTPIHVIRYWRA